MKNRYKEIINYINGYIDEGQFTLDGSLTGFGRKIYDDGNFRIGWFKDQAMCGYGYKLFRKGASTYGIFMNGKLFKGEATGKAS